MTPKEHAQVKGLEKQNLRDHMSEFELIFTALGEAATRTLTIRDDAQGFNQNHESATEGGRMAGDALKNFEKNIGQSVVSSDNFLGLKTEPKNKIDAPEDKA